MSTIISYHILEIMEFTGYGTHLQMFGKQQWKEVPALKYLINIHV